MPVRDDLLLDNDDGAAVLIGHGKSVGPPDGWALWLLSDTGSRWAVNEIQPLNEISPMEKLEKGSAMRPIR
jgi:hypothetical protein